MKDDLLRHGLTASVAALLASFATIALQGATAPTTPPAAVDTPSRGGRAADPALLDALHELRGAIEGMQVSLGALRSEARRPAAVATQDAPAGNGASADAPAAVAPIGSIPGTDPAFEASLAGAPGPIVTTAVEDFGARYFEFTGQDAPDPNLNPAREYLLRTIPDLIRDFGRPTAIYDAGGGMQLHWETASGQSVFATFVDGRLVRIHD